MGKSVSPSVRRRAGEAGEAIVVEKAERKHIRLLPLQGGEVVLHLVILVELALDVIVDGNELLGSGGGGLMKVSSGTE